MKPSKRIQVTALGALLGIGLCGCRRQEEAPSPPPAAEQPAMPATPPVAEPSATNPPPAATPTTPAMPPPATQ